jgi:predicted nuclease with TOPRIM domain
MDEQARLTLAEIGLRMADAVHELTEEVRELRKEHTAMRQQVERIQEAVSATGAQRVPSARCEVGRAPAQRPPSPVAALRTRYSGLFDAGEFRQAASVYAELLAAEAQECQCGHVYRYHDTEHGRCRVCPCNLFMASQFPEEGR